MNYRHTYNTVYKELFNTDPPQSMTKEASQADILSSGRGFMGGFDYTLQLQVGCPGGCLYCYVPSGPRLTPAKVKGERGRTWGFVVRDKQNIVKKFKKYMSSGTLADKTIYWSGVTDPYAAQPSITQSLWQTLINFPQDLRPRRIAVQTRFRPDRDVELIKQYNEATIPSDGGPAVVFSYSIGSDRNDLIKAWEKATPQFEQRMRAIERLRRAGLFAVATLSPLGLWSDLPGTLLQFKRWGVTYITTLCFKQDTRSANTPSLFLKYLQENFPMVLDPSWQAEKIGEMRQVYGNNAVLVGKEGFESLTHPHQVVHRLSQ